MKNSWRKNLQISQKKKNKNRKGSLNTQGNNWKEIKWKWKTNLANSLVSLKVEIDVNNKESRDWECWGRRERRKRSYKSRNLFNLPIWYTTLWKMMTMMMESERSKLLLKTLSKVRIWSGLKLRKNWTLAKINNGKCNKKNIHLIPINSSRKEKSVSHVIMRMNTGRSTQSWRKK